MVSIEDKIWIAIKAKWKEIKISPSDSTSFGEDKEVGKSLEMLTTKGNIVRRAKGIYKYPEIDMNLGFSALMPSIEQIAETIARWYKIRIVPTYAGAMNNLGKFTQVPLNIVCLTDGAPRKINLGDIGLYNSNTLLPKYLIHQSVCNVRYICP